MSATTQDTSRYDFQKPYRFDLSALWDARGEGQYKGVFWFGAAGTGKTRTAKEFVEWARTQYVPCRAGGQSVYEDYIEGVTTFHQQVSAFSGSALELVAETQGAMNHVNGARTLYEMVEEIKRADVVRLEDLGREREDYGQSVMFTLLDAALESGAFVLVTANRSAKELADYYKGDAGLRSRLSALKQSEWPATLPNLRKPEAAQ